MKVIFEIGNMLKSEVQEIPDHSQSWKINILHIIHPMSQLEFRKYEIAYYTKEREPVWIFRLSYAS